MKNSNLNGAVIWGSSNDVNSQEKCKALEKYVESVLGPLVAEFVQLGSAKTISNSYDKVEKEAGEEGKKDEEEDDQPSNDIPEYILNEKINNENDELKFTQLPPIVINT